MWTWEDNGCQGWASHEINPEQWESNDDGTQFEALWEDMDAMWVQIQEDPRMAESADGWIACMADAGHPGLTDIWAGSNLVYEWTEPVWEEIYADVNWDDEVDHVALDLAYREGLAEFTDQEIEVAVADWHCKDGVDYYGVEYEVQRDHQQRFLDSHRAELDAYAEWIS